jgi:membrane associated rhomboid family serine protease
MAAAAQKPGFFSHARVVLAWIGVLWVVFIAQVVCWNVFGYDLAVRGGVRPRTESGLVGILTAHFLHAGFAHIFANSVALLILGWLACWYDRRMALVAVLYSMVMAGAVTWVIADAGSCHIGASGVAFGLIGFLLANAAVRRDFFSILLALGTLFLFQGALSLMLPAGLIPHAGVTASATPISWQMHLGGFLGGLCASWHLRARKS